MGRHTHTTGRNKARRGRHRNTHPRKSRHDRRGLHDNTLRRLAYHHRPRRRLYHHHLHHRRRLTPPLAALLAFGDPGTTINSPNPKTTGTINFHITFPFQEARKGPFHAR